MSPHSVAATEVNMTPVTLRATLAVLTSLAMIPLSSGCGDDKKGSLYEGLHTAVNPAAIGPGGTAAVTCTTDKASKKLKPEDFTARVISESALFGDAAVTGINPAMMVGGTRSGTYRVFCEIPKLQAIDTVGAQLTINAGPVLKTRPTFGQNPLTAGTFTSIGCVGVDQWNNEVPLLDPSWDLPPELEVANGQVTSETAGSFPVSCGVGDSTRETVTLLVVPGNAERVELTATPARPGYLPGAAVTLEWTVYDRFDNELADVPGTLNTPTSPRLTVVDAETHRYKLEEEGVYRFSVTLAAPLEGMRDDLDLLVDATAPVIVVDYPPRGATLKDTDNGGGPVVVRGTVIDAGGLDTLSIGGKAVAIQAGGRFEYAYDSTWGLNIIDLIAVDKAGNRAEASPTFGYSDGWLDFQDQDARGLQHEDGIVVLLGQNFFDDGVHNHNQLNDLATLVEVLLGDLDIQTPISTALAGVNQSIPLVNQTMRVDLFDGQWIDLTFVGDLSIILKAADTTDIGPTAVNIDSREGGLDFDMIVGTDSQPAIAVDLVFEVKLQFDVLADSCNDFFCFPLTSGQAYAQALVTSHLAMGDFDVFMAAEMAKTWHQPMQLSISELTSVVGDFDLQPIQDVTLNLSLTGIQGLINTQYSIALSDFIDLGQLFAGILNPLANTASALVPQLLNPVLQSLLGPVLSGLFDLLVIDTVLPIPSFFGGDSVELGFSTELSTVAFEDDGGTIGLATGLHTDKGIDLESLGHDGDLHEEDPEGAILRGTCLGTSTDDLQWGWDPSVGFGVRTDVINAGFYAAWWSGGLNAPLDLAGLAGGALPINIDNLAVDMEWLMPPILDDCSKAGIQASVGDLYLTLTGDILGSSVEVGMYVDLVLDVQFVSHDGSDGGAKGLSIQFGAITDSDVEIAYLDDGGLGDTLDIGTLLENLPSILGGFITGQEFGPFELPSMDLSTLVPGLPAGTTLGLGGLRVTPQAGYAVIGGNLGQ